MEDVIKMVAHIEGQVESIDDMFEVGFENLCRELSLLEGERSD